MSFIHSFLQPMIIIILALVFSNQVWSNDFIDRVLAKSEVYQTYSTSEEAGQMALEGLQNQVDLNLIAQVPDADKTAEDYFMLANMLYANNHQLSFELMKKAYDLNPKEVSIIYEMGMHHHRAGNYEKAIEYYLEAMKTEFISIGHNGYALLADCYLRTSEYEKAMDAWINADPRDNRIKIEKAIYNIYGAESPMNERSTLITEIGSGELYKFGDLLELNHKWRIDWWNQKVQENYLAHDLKLAGELLADKPQLLEEVKLLNDILSHQVNTTQFLERLKDLKIWGGEARLPEVPALTYYMIKKMTDLDLISVDEIVQAYEQALLKKKAANTINDYEFRILSFLYASTDEEKIKDLDLFAWKNRHSKISAENYLLTQYYKDKLDLKELKQALKDFPNSVNLNALHLNVNESEDLETDIYAAMVAAEYPNLKVEQSSKKLRAFYRSLAKKINHKSYTDTLNK
ncbi:MAG: tetratricopeptide repeat protein [Marinicella sp.]